MPADLVSGENPLAGDGPPGGVSRGGGAGNSPRPLLGGHLPASVGVMTITLQHHTPNTIAVGLGFRALRLQRGSKRTPLYSAIPLRAAADKAGLEVGGSAEARRQGVYRTLQCSPSAGSLSLPVQGPWKDSLSAPRVGGAAPKEGSRPSSQPLGICTSDGKQGSLAFFSFRSGHSVPLCSELST